MTPITILKAQAAAKRDAIIAQAQLEYRQDIQSIRALMRQIKTRKPRVKAKTAKTGIRSDAYGGMTTIQASRLVLADGRPRRIAEIVLEMQARGHRSKDDPDAVIKTLRAAFTYHEGKFVRDDQRRWTLAK